MVERQQEELVLRIEQVEQESFHRARASWMRLPNMLSLMSISTPRPTGTRSCENCEIVCG